MVNKYMFGNINKQTLIYLVLFQIIVITVSNFLVSIPIEFLNLKLTWSAFSFPLVVLAIDLTIRILGKSIARATIALSYPFAIISSIGVLLIEGSSVNEALRIGFASASAYGISTLLDVYIFQVIREKYKYWWLAPSVSTVFANVIDTFVFFYAAFYNSTDEYMKENWTEIAVNQSFIKIVIGLLFFLPFYGILLNYLMKKIKKG
jgi:uncharacterized integral membrane protein (TIGR00697 family)|tara:strand:+ start:1161 stop:1775 length:615 start_codon:yes stop_codon:yes gene_type:complete